MALPYRLLDAADDEVVAFLSWQGQPPPQIRKHVSPQTRAGVVNHGLLEIGEWGLPITVSVKGIADNFNDACDLEADYYALIGQTLKVEFAGRNWVTEYDTWHDILNVEIRAIRAEALIESPKYGVRKVNCGVILAELTIAPKYIEPPPA
jgi:hypothetical protein